MAHKATSFKVDDKKQAIVLYTNVEAPVGEKTMIEFYLGKGYTPMFEEKKKSKTIPEMREEMKDDQKALDEFNKIYDTKPAENATKKEKSEVGFFGACKYYTKWAKEQKKAKA